MLDNIKVGWLYRSVIGKVVFVTGYNKRTREVTYYYLDNPDVLGTRSWEHINRFWQSVG